METPKQADIDAQPLADRESSAQLVSQVAQSAQQRQELTQREALRERPDFILDIEQSEVMYTLRPKFVPLGLIDYPTFAKSLYDKWGMSLDLQSLKVDPTVLQRASEESQSQGETFENAVMKHVLQGSEPAFGFSRGKYPVSKTEFVQILGIRLSFEAVLVSVGGIGQVAEAIAQEVLELVNAAAGADRPWKVLADEVQIIGYATRTKVDLGSASAFESLLSSQFRSFLDSQVVAGQQFGAHAGGYHARHDLGPPPDPQVVYALQELTLLVSSFDIATANSRETDFRFRVTARGDYRSGTVSISSELPYEIHEQCVGKLIEALAE
jgi:hypothetical protein